MGIHEWRLFHVLSVVLFLGNLITGLFWAAHATRTRELAVISHTFVGIRRADRWFTIPGGIGILIGGIAAAIRVEQPIFGTGWIIWAIALLGIAAVVLASVRSGLQRDLQEMTATGTADEVSWKEYDLLYGYWRTWTLIVIAAPLLAVVLMVYRPSLPAF